MLGETHILVANLALTCLNQKERHILFPRWGGIESGATLSDEFRIMWEPEEVGSSNKQLVHRCWVDSNDPKNHGCITRAVDHALGSISFIGAHSDEELAEEDQEIDFLENLGMLLGVTSHHIADLCTSVHVGHLIDYESLGFTSLSKFHNKVERDILRFRNQASLKFFKPRIVILSSKYFWNIANNTYEELFLQLNKIYKKKKPAEIAEMSTITISNAVMHTCNVWHTILTKTAMTRRPWSMQPLI